ncbi:MAG: polysaccharide biosynthesis C-terminal domain-containing protein [Clostridia bacterium]|nr:polysaccharide biosynthesis C-terminal domain-containing protein [Clostridia bacterium]
MTRSRKALLNTSTALIREAVVAICGLILPRLILSHFGSAYNGIVSSISQFISCVALLKSGIGSVTRAALYKPLAEDDSRGISEVVNATESFLRKVALIFLGGALIFSAVYPFLVSGEFDWFFVFTLCLILSIDTFVQYYYGLTYQMLIEADQSQFIISLIRIATVILNTVIASLLILAGAGIHLVKLGSALVYLIQPIFFAVYAKRRYHVDKKVPANSQVISQRWSAFGHQLASFVNTNTDVIVITVFLGVREVSVYTVFFAVANGLRTILQAFTSGIAASFGNMMAKDEHENLKRRYDQVEFFLVLLSAVLFTIAGLMFIPYVSVYTRGVTDVNYIRPVFGVLLCISAFVASISSPIMSIIQAAGRFKDTMKVAVSEAVINITLSVILVNFIGLNGIIVGTIVAGTYKLIRYNWYVTKNIMPTLVRLLVKMGLAALIAVLCGLISRLLPLGSISTWGEWLLWAVVVGVIVVAVAMVLSLLLFRKTLFGLIRFLFAVVHPSKKKNEK